MICRLSGRLLSVDEQTAVLEVGGVCYELLIPVASCGDLNRLLGNDVSFFTIQYLEGSLGGGNLTPRLIGFLSESDRAFFNELIRVSGISTRKALRAMSVPANAIAAAVERSDERALVALPEIGRKTAALMITELRGRLTRFLAPAAIPTPLHEMTDAQRVALEILIQWGDRRADAQRWIAAAVEADPSLEKPDEIVRAAYRIKR